MEKSLTINYTYYNNPQLLKRIVSHYSDVDYCNFQIIDDGSPNKIELTSIPNDWSVYRINEDIGWNNEGARNILMETTSTEWNLLIDMDFVMETDDIKVLINLLPRLDKDSVHRFNTTERRYPYPCNSFLITKEKFVELGGYDRAFLGMYGADVSLLAKILPIPYKIETISLTKIIDEVAQTNKTGMKEEFKKYVFDLERKKYVTLTAIRESNLTRIDWIDEDIHKQHYKNFTWSKLQ